MVRVSGELAAPYGNLELRPDSETDIVLIGSGAEPTPAPLHSTDMGVGAEGLLGVIIGTIDDIDRRSSGSVSITVRDDHGEIEVYLFPGVGSGTTELERGQDIRVTGIVGQRSSRVGAEDGYRIWPRDHADIELLASGQPGATPPPSESPDKPPPEDPIPRVSIREALPGQTVTIVGTVTAKAGLFDPDGRRVTVQDASGAILVRYPVDAKPARLGRVVRATGEVGTWFGATQLETDEKPRVRGRTRAVPSTLRRPPVETDEWQLVKVSVRITDVERSGDTWRAEATLRSGGELPIVGLAGSGIASGGLVPGRAAKIVGIVKRAHPSASDQRFAIAPRSRKDIKLGRIKPPLDEDDGDDGDDDDDDSVGAASTVSGSGRGFAPTATLDALASFDGSVVRVSGRLERIKGPRLTLHDGTARGTARLADEVEVMQPALRIGEVVNITGRVRERAAGRHELIVQSSADVRRAAELKAGPAASGTGTGSAPMAGSTRAVETLPTHPATSVPAHDGRPAMVGLLLAAVLAGAAALLVGAVVLLRWRSRILTVPSDDTTTPGRPMPPAT